MVAKALKEEDRASSSFPADRAPQPALWGAGAPDRSATALVEAAASAVRSSSVTQEPASGLPPDAPRTFFPCNREDAPLLLGGCCISHWFADPNVRLAIDASGAALIEEGLRAEEELL